MSEKDKTISWMYEGAKASVNREDYLLGKRIDKNFELYTDTLKKDKESNEEVFVKKSKIDVPVPLPAIVVRTEDPLVAMRIREETRRQELLHNPSFKMKAKQILMEEFEKMQRKKNKKDKKKKRKRSESNNDSSEYEHKKKSKKKRKISEGSYDSDAEGNKKSKQMNTANVEEDSYRERKVSEKPIRRKDESTATCSKHAEELKGKSSSTISGRERGRRHKESDSDDHKKEDYRFKKRSKDPYERDMREPSSHHSHEQREHSREHGYSYRRRTDSTRHREHEKKDEVRKMKAADMEKKRQAMLENAKWKEQVKKDNAKFARDELEREQEVEEEGSKTNSTFIKAFKKVNESQSVADSLHSRSRRQYRDN